MIDTILADLTRKWGLAPDFAVRMAILILIMDALGGSTQVLSGLRSHSAQRALRDQGRPAARQSWHTVGRAIDIYFAPQLRPVADLLAKMLGLRAGGSFSTPDPGHYDLPGPNLPDFSW